MSARRAIILGAGYRGRAYADYARVHPDELQIVGVADPVAAGSIPSPQTWSDWRSCLASQPEAEIAVIALPDSLHRDAAVAALEAGYHLLLEKPIATTEAECREVLACARRTGGLVLLGHVLRYTPYFMRLKALVDSGELGEIVSIAHQESVGFRKFAHSFVRGTFANAEKSSPIILQKCSHDFDLFAWWLGGRRCLKVSSFGSLAHFRPESKPVGAAERCLDCPAAIEQDCVWSARRHYLESDELHYLFPDASEAAFRRRLAETDFGRCVYDCGNNVPDHQSVTMMFEGDVTVCHLMTGFTCRNVRQTCITLTRGEIVGDGESIEAVRFDGKPVRLPQEEGAFRPNDSRHGGGDFNLVAEMLRILRRNDPQEIRKKTDEALESHLICFAAEKSRLAGGAVVEINRS